VNELEEITRLSFDCIHVIGGGANADYLNELTAHLTGKTLYAGPSEATAIGNILAQMIASQELDNLAKARECVMRSFEMKEYDAVKGGYYDNEGKI
jgi:rhamnulokinase